MSAPPIDVVAGLVFREGRLLVARRPDGTHLAGFWEFPGGKVRPGEDWTDALRRELREETGIEVVPGPLVEDLVHVYPEKAVRIRFYRCEWESGEARPIECAAVAWAGRHELGAYRFPEADQRLLEVLRTDDRLWSTPG